jgi:hypothetical protein
MCPRALFLRLKFRIVCNKTSTMRIPFFVRRPRRTTSVTPIDWERVTNWLSDMEECLPEGVYLQVCDLAKRLHSAQTSHEQHDLMQELMCHNEDQWAFATKNLLCC